MAELRWTDEALQWLEDIFEYIAQEDPAAAAQVVNGIYDRAQVLASHPEIGYRYEEVFQAIIDEEWELGTHHWGKLRNVFNVALMKRPNRTPYAESSDRVVLVGRRGS